MNETVEEFGKRLVQSIRDGSITSAGLIFDGAAQTPLKEQLAQYDPAMVREIIGMLVPEIVDDTLFHLLAAIDSGTLDLSFQDGEGASVNLTEEGEGELSGWYLGEDGWAEKYSSHS